MDRTNEHHRRHETDRRRFELAGVNFPVMLLLVVVTALLAGHAGAVRVTARPVTLGTVNLGKVLEELVERAEWDTQIRAREESMLTEIRSRQAGLNETKARLDALAEGAEHDQLRESLAFELVRLDNWFKWKRLELDRERALMWQSLYRSIRSEAERLAAADGVDLVIVNDSVNELRTNPEAGGPVEGQVLQQITSRRVIFAAREIDLTERLVTRMNNARAARP